MVRLQKILYERILNTEVLGRARKLTTPAKWFITNPLQHHEFTSGMFYYQTTLGRLLRPLFQNFVLMNMRFSRFLLLKKGITYQDKYLHDDVDLRRSVLFEHIARENLHPYQWLLKVKRRQRFYRIQRGLKGFFVPEFIKSQVKSQSYRDMKKLQKQWFAFTHNNYWSDITPSAKRSTVGTLAFFDLFMNYGIWRHEAWQRYFFTQRDEGWCTEEQLKAARDVKKFPIDLTTPEGKKQFQIQFNRLNDKCPGLICPEGEKFDFKKYYEEIGA